MPRRKPSRAPVRAKPVIPDDSINEPDMAQEQKKEKLRLILKDYDRQVAVRVAQMESQYNTLLQSIQQIYKTQLNRYPASTRQMLWSDYIKQKENNDNEKSVTTRESMAGCLREAEGILQLAKKRGRKPKAAVEAEKEFLIPQSVPRSTRGSRQKPVLGPSQVDNQVPPPSTGRGQRTKKMQEVAATPLNQSISANQKASLIITPKFDPRTPLPPGTIKRKPKLGEVGVSLAGSPLQLWPASIKSAIRDIEKGLDDQDISEDTKAEVANLFSRVYKIIE